MTFFLISDIKIDKISVGISNDKLCNQQEEKGNNIINQLNCSVDVFWCLPASIKIYPDVNQSLSYLLLIFSTHYNVKYYKTYYNVYYSTSKA